MRPALPALARVTGGSAGVRLICRAAERVGQKQESQMRALLAAAIVAVGVGALGASNALASAANGTAIAKAADETSQVVAAAWHRGPRGRCWRN